MAAAWCKLVCLVLCHHPPLSPLTLPLLTWFKQTDRNDTQIGRRDLSQQREYMLCGTRARAQRSQCGSTPTWYSPETAMAGLHPQSELGMP